MSLSKGLVFQELRISNSLNAQQTSSFAEWVDRFLFIKIYKL